MGDKETLKRIREISILSQMGHRHDRTILVKCPFHDDSRPSCWIKPNNFYNCFGCGKTGRNFVDFCKDLGYSIPEIVKEYGHLTRP
jgi:DNA primase